MFPYYCLALLPMTVALIQNDGVVRIGGSHSRDKENRILSIFFWSFMLLLSLRGRYCGSDTSGYQSLFFRVYDLSWIETVRSVDHEVGYRLLNKAVGQVTDNVQFFMLVTSVLSVYPIYRFYKRASEGPVLTIALFLSVAPFNMYFSGIRQTLAMGFTFWAWQSVEKKKLLNFVCIVLLAMQFHRSSFILLVLYPLYHFKITAKSLFFVVPAILAVYVFNNQIFNFLLRFLWDDYGGSEETGAVTALLLLIIFAVYTFVIPDGSKLDKEIIGYRNVLLFAVVIQCFAPIHNLAMRMNYYFLLFVPVLIPKIANRSKKAFRYIANGSVLIMVLFFMVYFFFRAHRGADPLNIYPYIPFWNT